MKTSGCRHILLGFFLSITFYGLAHNRTPNTLIITTNDSSVSIYAKAFTATKTSNFQINANNQWKLLNNNKSHFKNMQVEDWKYLAPDLTNLEVTSLNGNRTSIQLNNKNGANVNWLETKRKFAVDFNSEVNELEVVKSYILLGIEHILIGFDHLLFVLGLLFIVARKSILWTISAFTIAHSITLGLAVSGMLDPANLGISPIWVEAMIAGSILILALEMRKAEKHTTQKAVGVAFTFGLLHGLGFAGVLQELGLPDSAFWQALASFNIGVEMGQLLFIALLLLLFQLIKKHISFGKLTVGMSLVVGGLAAFWCIERSLMLANII